MTSNKMLCRLCLGQSVVNNSLLENNGVEMVLSLTGITISQDDVLPTVSCVKCWIDLKTAYDIQQKFMGVAAKLSPFSDTNNLSFEIFEPEIITQEILNDIVNSDEKFVCPICGIISCSNVELYSHIGEHYTCEQTCDKCKETFVDINSYKNHECVKNLKEIFKCGKCDMKFQYKTLYDVHVSKMHIKSVSVAQSAVKNSQVELFFKRRPKKPNKNVKVKVESDSETENSNYSCPECSRPFTDKRLFKAHVKTHERENCPVCNRSITKYNLSKHVNSHSEDKRVCHLCGVTCKNTESLRGHLYHTHTKRSFPCNICGKVYRKSYTRTLHIKKDHTFEKNNICEQCGKTFYTKYTLNKHVKMTHLKLRPFECKYCLRGFSSRFALVTHTRQHTNEAPYKCPICGEGFRQNVSLRAHKKSKHSIIEVKNAKCKVCSKEFVDNWALNSHMARLHS